MLESRLSNLPMCSLLFLHYEVGKTATPVLQLLCRLISKCEDCRRRTRPAPGISIAIVKDNEDKPPPITSALTMLFQEVTPSYSVPRSSSQAYTEAFGSLMGPGRLSKDLARPLDAPASRFHHGSRRSVEETGLL